MSKMFLTKEQIQKLREYGWEIPDTKDGTFWVGQDWDDGESLLSIVDGCMDLSLEDDESNDIQGYDFLVVAVRPNVVEEEE
jgi:hypothetical protein